MWGIDLLSKSTEKHYRTVSEMLRSALVIIKQFASAVRRLNKIWANHSTNHSAVFLLVVFWSTVHCAKEGDAVCA